MDQKGQGMRKFRAASKQPALEASLHKRPQKRFGEWLSRPKFAIRPEFTVAELGKKTPGRQANTGEGMGGVKVRGFQGATGFGSSASSLIQFFRSHARTHARGPATAREICRPAEEFLAAPR